MASPFRYHDPMYVRSKTSKLSPRKTVQIVEAYVTPEGKRRQRIVQHLGVACDERQLEELWALGTRLIPELQARAREEKALREGQGLLFESSPEDYERPVPQDVRVRVKSLRNVEHVLEGPFEVWGDVFSKLGLEGIFGTGNRDLGSTNLLKLCLTAKLYDGGSKRRAVQWINETLGLDLGKDRFYRMMDRLAARIDQVKERGFVCGRHLAAGDVSLLLFDVTTLYFESFEEDPDDPPSEASSSSSEGEATGQEEGREQAAAAGMHRSSWGQPEDDEGGFPQDPGLPGRGLRRNGYSKDNKVNETQVVLALATSAEGIPLWYDLFPGNMPEGKTLLESLAGVGKRLDPKETWLVADGAMLQTANRTALEKNGYRYVLGSSLRKLPATERAEALDRSGYAPLRGTLPRAPFEEDEEGTGGGGPGFGGPDLAPHPTGKRQHPAGDLERLQGPTGCPQTGTPSASPRKAAGWPRTDPRQGIDLQPGDRQVRRTGGRGRVLSPAAGKARGGGPLRRVARGGDQHARGLRG